jgi:hypothetical protein
MALPSTSREAMVQAIQQFRAGERSPQGPKPGDDWLGKGNHRWVIVHNGEPYPLKEIIRLAVRFDTGSAAPQFWGGTGGAKAYAERYGFTVVPKAQWRRTAT